MNKFELDTPVLVVDLDLMEKNIRDMAEIGRQLGVSIIPHAKVHKVVEIAQAQIAAGADGVAIAKISEGEVLASHGIGKLLMTSPLMGSQKMERLRSLTLTTDLSVVVDSFEVAQCISEALRSGKKKVGILIEIDSGLGRCGLLPGEPVVELASKICRLPGVVFRGLKTAALDVYDESTPDGITNTEHRACQKVLETADQLRENGLQVAMMVVGSTPSIWSRAIPRGVTHVQPGSYVFNSVDGIATGAVLIEKCALTVLATVISRPARNRVVVDAGFKALTLVEVPKIPGYGLIKGMPDVVIQKLYEEHGVLHVPPENPLRIGDKVEIIPNSCSAITNQFDELAAVRRGVIEAIWTIPARGKYT